MWKWQHLNKLGLHGELLNMSTEGISKGMSKKGRMYEDERVINNVYTVNHDQLLKGKGKGNAHKR
jgi:hypothetical protein